tara:strand:- start:5616 stop:5786 length:171 start_codon:yes stop_codon:yes gene_type:complete
MKVSTCCGAEATDPLMLDYAICPECEEHCEFEDYDSIDEQIYNNINHEGGIKFFNI